MFRSWEAEDLFKERKQLADTWRKFQLKHVEFQDIDSERPPSVQQLQTTMRATMQVWEARGESGLSKARKNLLGFSETLLQFSDLFSIIPDGDKYISLFTGVISTTVKVCVVYDDFYAYYAIKVIMNRVSDL